MQWQLYWMKWHLGYDTHTDSKYGFIEHYLFIGPLQVRWTSLANSGRGT